MAELLTSAAYYSVHTLQDTIPYLSVELQGQCANPGPIQGLAGEQDCKPITDSVLWHRSVLQLPGKVRIGHCPTGLPCCRSALQWLGRLIQVCWSS